MMPYNERLNYFDVWFFCSFRYDVNGLVNLICWQFRGQNREAKPDVNQKNPSSEERKLPLGTVDQTQNLEDSNKIIVQSPHLNCQLLIQTVNFIQWFSYILNLCYLVDLL